MTNKELYDIAIYIKEQATPEELEEFKRLKEQATPEELEEFKRLNARDRVNWVIRQIRKMEV